VSIETVWKCYKAERVFVKAQFNARVQQNPLV